LPIKARAVAQPRFASAYLFFTAAVCGALIRIIEIMGSRVLGPLFGVSLFV
jgi:hypothetical protein